jgi:hypothetical protein
LSAIWHYAVTPFCSSAALDLYSYWKLIATTELIKDSADPIDLLGTFTHYEGTKVQQCILKSEVPSTRHVGDVVARDPLVCRAVYGHLVFTGSPFVLGGALSCGVLAIKHLRLARRHIPAPGQASHLASATTLVQGRQNPDEVEQIAHPAQ